MARKKQIHPHHAVIKTDEASEFKSNKNTSTGDNNVNPVDIRKTTTPPFVLEIDKESWGLDEHLDISEAVLKDLDVKVDLSNYSLGENFYRKRDIYLRFVFDNTNGQEIESMARRIFGRFSGRFFGGNVDWMFLEIFEHSAYGEGDSHSLICSGNLDGPDESVLGLVHLVILKFVTLRPVLESNLSNGTLSPRIRIQILQKAFDSCSSLLDTSAQQWRKNMMSAIAWLRPDIVTSEAKYGVHESSYGITGSKMKETYNFGHKMFDSSAFYEAIKSSKGDPVVSNYIHGLAPELKPYQRRGVFWMLKREKTPSVTLSDMHTQYFSPFCVPLDLVDKTSRIFYNPFSGNVSLHPEYFTLNVFGGILADEMGLGKTVELLACIICNKKETSDTLSDNIFQVTEDPNLEDEILKRERIGCVCGAISENLEYNGLWVQCDLCDVWQHADCVGYSPASDTPKPVNGKVPFMTCSTNTTERLKNKSKNDVVFLNGDHTCRICSEIVQATKAPVSTGATLIVCPTSILPQWNAEITRHTVPGSLKLYIYEGVRERSVSYSGVDIRKIIDADIVLTTYDILREDLSHDSGRHQGGLRSMRFNKRYPVVPTPLTGILWWRICLDEAQMVESSSAAATEMALRLHTKYRWCISGTPIQHKLDDLYGLLNFLQAKPFDTPKWWNMVIRDPYEMGDPIAIEFAHKFFKQIMWRSSKIHVADELHLPPQDECFKWLILSPIEQHFYQRQHETCLTYAREVIDNFGKDISKIRVPGSFGLDSCDAFITQMEAARLLKSLLKLRQACCHPQVGSSRLRTLQQSPISMQEVLLVLIQKTKIEGEEALRRLVLALNALAGISIINGNVSEAISIYKGTLALAENHSDDFRLDDLLSLHIHHNLASMLEGNYSASKRLDVEKCDHVFLKRQKISYDSALGLPNNVERDCDAEEGSKYHNVEYLIAACDTIKKKHLSIFMSKMVDVRMEFQKCYMQVCDALCGRKRFKKCWWLKVLDKIELDKNYSDEWIGKIQDAISEVTRSSRILSGVESVTALKYYIQNGLDLLETSRQMVIDRLIVINKTMDSPSEEDVARVRCCPNCYGSCDGPLCIHCELDELFQVYEARLFRANKVHGGVVTSAEEALDLQKKTNALNRFYWNLSHSNGGHLESTSNSNEENRRGTGGKVVVSKLPSWIEVALNAIKSHSKSILGKDGVMAAAKHLLFLENMRKEYTLARSLATSQAQVMRAHDEIKMAMSRLRIRENINDKSIDVLSIEESFSAKEEFRNEEVASVCLLEKIKGQLRYLKGLMQSRQKVQQTCANISSLEPDTVASGMAGENKVIGDTEEEDCPICHDKIGNQKMVFQCGHFICSKCLLSLTVKKLVPSEWIMCPKCRQISRLENIAFADDSDINFTHNGSERDIFKCQGSEASIAVQGSYGTKMEAITRRILWIKSTYPCAKILVFSSWNDVLDVLEHALTANNIVHVRMKGGRKSQAAILRFNSLKVGSEFVQVMLLLFKHGANGLNLLQAQHVVLVEPLLNPSIEAQAISRIHRIGQQNKTVVHRFIVKDTVEEGIHWLNRGKAQGYPFVDGSAKDRDDSVLTIRDIEALFGIAVPSSTVNNSATCTTEAETESGDLRRLPPSMAAAIAAERRLRDTQGNGQ